MAETLLLPLVRAAAGKAADALVQRVTSMCGVDDDRHKLERQLLAVQYKLADAEMKSETNQYIKRWMKDFRTVAYEANDVLDDFQYEALRREAAQIGKSKTSKVLSHFTSNSPLLFRLTMSRKLSNVLKKINEFVEEMNKFGLQNLEEAPQVPYRQTHAAPVDPAEIFGRDHDREVLVKLLLDQRDQQNVQVLPIFGMGGLGKTTVAKMVYNDRRVQQHFQSKMWHCVSDNFDTVALVKSIIELATNERPNVSDELELLRQRLEKVIGPKRFLLILDDVWNEDERMWEDQLRPLLCSTGGPGSVIVVTCRSRQVASIMGTLGPYELKCLSAEDSWELFSRKAFTRGVKEQEELVTIGRRIVKKCRGVPLALKTVGSLMSSMQHVQEWETIERSNIGSDLGGKNEILSILKLSYTHLTPETKQCFAFCAIFPKDYEMEKDMLIQLWMANGFIQQERTVDSALKGELIFNELVWRSFLQDVKPGMVCYPHARPYESVLCKMHDLMHDLAKDVTDECTTVEDLTQHKSLLKDARHMYIAQSGLEQISGLSKATSLRTLLITSLVVYPDLEEAKLMPLQALTAHRDLEEAKLMSVRALSYVNPSVIHCQVMNAKHLRYLEISSSHIVRLPDSVSMLYNLQTLRLNGCLKLQLLPDGISAMKMLIHLYLLGCDHLERMPLNIGLLSNLCTLTTFVVDTESGRGIEELKDLCHLGNRLELFNLRNIKSGQNAKKANLHQKQKVNELLLCWGSKKEDEPEDEVCNEEEVLVSLAPHSKLKILEVYGYGSLEISQWMKDPEMFRCLRKLTVSNCPRCKDLPIVWFSDSLEYLCAENMCNLTTLCKSIGVETEGYNTTLRFFPKLKKMVLRRLPNLKRWTQDCDGESSRLLMFPLLEDLEIIKCPKLASVPGCPVLKNMSCCSLPISSLSHLTTLVYLFYDGTGFLSESMPFCSWPSLVILQLRSQLASMTMPLENQESQSQPRPLVTLRHLCLLGPNCFATTSGLSKSHLLLWKCFTFLEELGIHGCDELVCWPLEELRSLVRLRFLTIVDCNNLEGRGLPYEETLPLPQLEKLMIQFCGSLQYIPKLPASLQELDLLFCISLAALPPGLGDLPKLTTLSVNSSESLEALPDGMDGLTSLERFSIICCPGIEKFPQGFLQRLPALKRLCVQGCPHLSGRCREGGEYFHLVSSIPEKSIRETETVSNQRKFLRRLLPSCVDSN